MAEFDEATDPGFAFVTRNHEERISSLDERLRLVETSIARLLGAVTGMRWMVVLGCSLGSLIAALLSLWITKGP